MDDITMDEEQQVRNAAKESHLNQASVHLVDAIANIQAALMQDQEWLTTHPKQGEEMVRKLVAPLKAVLAECTGEVVYLQKLRAGGGEVV